MVNYTSTSSQTQVLENLNSFQCLLANSVHVEVSKKSILFVENTTTMHVHQPDLVYGALCTDKMQTELEKCEQDSLLQANKSYLHHYTTKSFDYFRCKALTLHVKRSGVLHRYSGRIEELKQMELSSLDTTPSLG